MVGTDPEPDCSLLSPRQRHWASAGFGWCGALLRRHPGEEF